MDKGWLVIAAVVSATTASADDRQQRLSPKITLKRAPRNPPKITLKAIHQVEAKSVAGQPGEMKPFEVIVTTGSAKTPAKDEGVLLFYLTADGQEHFIEAMPGGFFPLTDAAGSSKAISQLPEIPQGSYKFVVAQDSPTRRPVTSGKLVVVKGVTTIKFVSKGTSAPSTCDIDVLFTRKTDGGNLLPFPARPTTTMDQNGPLPGGEQVLPGESAQVGRPLTVRALVNGKEVKSWTVGASYKDWSDYLKRGSRVQLPIPAGAKAFTLTTQFLDDGIYQSTNASTTFDASCKEQK